MISRLYLPLMMLASAMTFVRGFAAAGVLSQEDFCRYAVAVSVGAFVSTFLSFGAIEGTSKRYPRMWNAGRPRDVVSDAVLIARTLLGRGLLACLVGGVLSWLHDSPQYFAAAIFSCTMALSTLAASLLRATASSAAIALLTLARAMVAFVLVMVGATILGWPAAIAGEAFAATAMAAVAWGGVRRMAGTQEDPSAERNMHEPKATNRDGLLLFYASLLSSAPFYLDRAFVSVSFGDETAGHYGLLVGVVTAAGVVGGIGVQRVGPAIVALQEQSSGRAALVRCIAPWVAAVLLTSVGASGSFFALTTLGVGSFAAYAATSSQVILIGFLAVFQATVFVEWIALSLDRERDILMAALGFFVCTTGLVLVTRSVDEFIGALAAARALHLILLLCFVARARSK
jgi:hypothetical protein